MYNQRRNSFLVLDSSLALVDGYALVSLCYADETVLADTSGVAYVRHECAPGAGDGTGVIVARFLAGWVTVTS